MANKYVREAASGTGTGADWTNAYTTIIAAEASASRGDTIYVADGSYAGTTFDVANSGTTLITVKKATVADHGTDTGWDNTYGDGQALITSDCTFGSSYWVIDGQMGSMSYDSTAYGFSLPAVVGTRTCFYIAGGVGVSYSNITIKHVAAAADGSDTSKMFVRGHSQIQTMDNITVTDCLLDGFGQAVSVVAMAATSTGLVFSRNICLNGYSSASNHGEQINANSADITNAIINDNIFDTCSGTGIITANNSDIVDTLIYNNIFIDSGGGNGVITGTSNGCLRNVGVYNNTFVRNTGGPWLATGTGTQTGNIAQNNLLYDMSGAHTATADYSYNGYFTCTSVPADANSVDSATNPFVSVATNNFRLVVGALAILAATNLSAYFSTDFAGNTRAASGPWDMGAYAYTVYTFKRLGHRLKLKGLAPV